MPPCLRLALRLGSDTTLYERCGNKGWWKLKILGKINTHRSKLMKKEAKFVVKVATNGEYFFVLIAGNGKVIATSETYTRMESALKGIASVKANAPDAKIIQEGAN